MRTKGATPRLDTYLQLVKQFPLRRLRGAGEYAEGLEAFQRLSLKYQDTRDRGVHDYLDLLASLIDQYESDAQLKADTSQRTPGDIIRHLMAANGLSVSGLAREIGVGQSNLSEMLSGRRDFSKAGISKLCARFGLSPSIFF